MGKEEEGGEVRNVIFGKYEMGRVLGQGTFAKVYYGRDLHSSESVAIKVINKDQVRREAGMMDQIQREISVMRLVRHPHVVQLKEVMATKTRIFFVMEYVRGGELFAKVLRGRLPEDQARRYFQQLISAVDFCHSRGVSHRDLKPENLLLDEAGNLKVSDFGLSALPDQLRDDGRLHTACGTPAYTAPEVVRRKGYDGAKADAWSCGVILFVLLAGSLPFDDANLALMYKKILKREYEFPPWISGSARRLVARLLDPNPETRMTIEALADHPWFKRSLSLDSQLSLMDLPPRDGAAAAAYAATAMNAFDIISLSSGLDLSGLFDRKKMEKRFTSTASVETIMRRIEEIGAKLGYLIERRKGGAVGLGRWGSVVLVVEVSEVVSPLLLVELRVEDDGSADDGEGFGWGELKAELGDIVFAWHSNEDS